MQIKQLQPNAPSAVNEQANAPAVQTKAHSVAAQTVPPVRELKDVAQLTGLLPKRDVTTNDAAATPSRPLLINFWATWCDPCREEFPDLVKINEDFHERGLDAAVISLDDVAEIKGSVPAFLARMKAMMPAYLLNVPDPEPAIKAIDPAWTGALPATFLYDARGQIVFKHVGRFEAKELRAAIEQTLKTAAPKTDQ